MIFFIGFTYITLMQWYYQRRRRQMYLSVISRAVRRSSILAQRVCSVENSSVGDLLHSPLLNISEAYNLRQNINDGNLLLSTVEPKQTVDMQSWTAYMDVHPASEHSSHNILVLLEADQPTNVTAYQNEILRIPEACRVHVLKHGCPVAWRPGLPFGIVLHCSLDGLVAICDAFGQGHLIVGENLEINKIITIQSHGKPHKFLQDGECQESSVDDTVRIAALNSATNSSKKLEATSKESDLFEEDVISDVKIETPETVPDSNTLIPDSAASDKDFVKADSVNVSHASVNNANAEGVSTEGITTESVNTEDVIVKSENTEVVSINNVNTDSKKTQGVNTDSASVNNGNADSMKTESLNTDSVNIESLNKDSVNMESVTKDSMSINNGNGDRMNMENVKTDSMNTESVKTESMNMESVNTDSMKSDGGSVNNGNVDTTKTENGSINNVSAASVKTNGTDTDSTNGDSGLKMHDASTSSSMKPPNVLIYCGNKDSVRRFKGVKASLEQCLNTDCYTMYHLQHADVNSVPWSDNTALLLVSCESLYDGINDTFSKYFQNGGKILSFGSPLDGEFVERKRVQNSIGLTELDIETWKGVATLRGPYNYVGGSAKLGDIVLNTMARDQATDEPVLMFVRHTLESDASGVAVLSQLLLERDPTEIVGDPEQFNHLKKANSTRLEILKHILITLGLDCSQQTPPDLTPCVLFTNKQDIKKLFMDSIQQRLKAGILRSRSLTLEFMEKATPSLQVKPLHLPVLTDDCEQTLKYFQPQKYWQHLETSSLGQVLLYTDVIPTTMTLFEGLQFTLKKHVGVIAIAGRQTAGKGRGSNTWLSPVGCAMFSLHVRVPMDSNLGRKVSFLQHIASLAVVHSVCTMPGYENIDLRLKWPNDIYYGKDIKLGGVIVNSSIMGKVVHAVIGCGFNVDNCNPTVCINDLIQQHNIQHNTKLDLCSIEQLIARTVTIIEQFINTFQKEDHETFCQMYYKTWLHSGVKVGLESEGGMEVTVCGLDEYGYLQVEMADGQRISVQPDGNSFDMMHNLILMKRR